MDDNQTIAILALLAVFWLLKRTVLDRLLYKAQPHDILPVASSSLERVYLPLKLWRSYYSPLWFVCIFGPIMGSISILFSLAGYETLVVSALGFLVFGLTTLIGPFWLWKRRVAGLNFKSVQVSVSADDTFKELKDLVSQNDWTILNAKEGHFIQAQSSMSGGSWGELITMAISTDSVLVNSIASPFKKASLATFGNNKSNEMKVLSVFKGRL